MTDDPDATALVIDGIQLVVTMNDTKGAFTMLVASEISPADLERQALLVMAFAFSGDHAAERFADLRRAMLERALDVGANDQDVTVGLEAIGAAEALVAGDLVRSNEIMQASEVPPIVLAWNAVALTAQCISCWLATDRTMEFFGELRRHFGIGDVA